MHDSVTSTLATCMLVICSLVCTFSGRSHCPLLITYWEISVGFISEVFNSFVSAQTKENFSQGELLGIFFDSAFCRKPLWEFPVFLHSTLDLLKNQLGKEAQWPSKSDDSSFLCYFPLPSEKPMDRCFVAAHSVRAMICLRPSPFLLLSNVRMPSYLHHKRCLSVWSFLTSFGRWTQSSKVRRLSPQTPLRPPRIYSTYVHFYGISWRNLRKCKLHYWKTR